MKMPVYDTNVSTGPDRLPFAGTTEQILADVATYAGLDVSELIVDFRSEDAAASLDRMERFAATIMRQAR